MHVLLLSLWQMVIVCLPRLLLLCCLCSGACVAAQGTYLEVRVIVLYANSCVLAVVLTGSDSSTVLVSLSGGDHS